MTIPNFITIARLLGVPLIVWLMIADRFVEATILFVIAGVSDAADGFIAKRFGATSELGAYLDPLVASHPAMDTLLLGCTHYPLLRSPIEAIVGPDVAVVDSAFTTALAVEDLLDALGSRAPIGAAAGHRVTTTGDVGAFVTVAQRLFGERLPDVESVAIEARAAVPVD